MVGEVVSVMAATDRKLKNVIRVMDYRTLLSFQVRVQDLHVILIAYLSQFNLFSYCIIYVPSLESLDPISQQQESNANKRQQQQPRSI